jgi:uncharacterized protein with GYD domain
MVMAQFLTTIRFTDQGRRELAGSPRRAEQFRRQVETAGGKVLLQTWAIGRFDGVVAFEAADDVQAARLLAVLAKEGFVRTETTRLIDEKEIATVLAK